MTCLSESHISSLAHCHLASRRPPRRYNQRGSGKSRIQATVSHFLSILVDRGGIPLALFVVSKVGFGGEIFVFSSLGSEFGVQTFRLWFERLGL